MGWRLVRSCYGALAILMFASAQMTSGGSALAYIAIPRCLGHSQLTPCCGSFGDEAVRALVFYVFFCLLFIYHIPCARYGHRDVCVLHTVLGKRLHIRPCWCRERRPKVSPSSFKMGFRARHRLWQLERRLEEEKRRTATLQRDLDRQQAAAVPKQVEDAEVAPSPLLS